LSKDHELVTAALRCLIAIEETKVLGIDFVKGLTQSRNQTVKMLAFIVIAKLSEEGVELPEHVVQLVIQSVDQVPIAGTTLLLLARVPEVAKVILKHAAAIEERILWIQVLALAARHETLIPDVRNVIQTGVFLTRVKSLDRALAKLKELVNL
jgi:hypothetical protein